MVSSGLRGYHMQLRPGSCLTNNVGSASYCSDNMCSWFSHGCPSEYGWLSLVELPSYWIAFAPETGPVPWTINSEIYLLQDRGVCGGRVATANWVSNFIMALTFLSFDSCIWHFCNILLVFLHWYTCFSIYFSFCAWN